MQSEDHKILDEVDQTCIQLEWHTAIASDQHEDRVRGQHDNWIGSIEPHIVSMCAHGNWNNEVIRPNEQSRG